MSVKNSFAPLRDVGKLSARIERVDLALRCIKELTLSTYQAMVVAINYASEATHTKDLENRV
jgi:hypothetical protein